MTHHEIWFDKENGFCNSSFEDNTYIDSMELHSNKEVNDKDPEFKVGDHVRISKYKHILNITRIHAKLV